MSSHALKINKLFQNKRIFIRLYLRSIDDYSLLDTFDKYQLNILNEYGLIISDYDTWLTCDGIIEYQGDPAPLQFYHQGSTWILLPLPERDNKMELRLSGVVFSEVGRELFHIVDQEPMPEYTEDLKKFFAEQNLSMIEVNNL